MINSIKILLLFSIVFLIWSVFPFIQSYYFPHIVNQNFAELGDSYGALNTLFSGLAFTGILISIYLQSNELKLNREELRLTRDELELTREEIKGQTAQLEAQVNSMEMQAREVSKQSFENTFFQMLHLHNEIIDFLSIKSPTNINLALSGEPVEGRGVFEELLYQYQNMESPEEKFYKDGTIRPFDEYYESFYTEYSGQIGHYLRNIYIVLKFVDESEVKDKKFYTNILRAQLSTYELTLLLLNCLSIYGKEKHKPLIEKYEFFEHLAYKEFPYCREAYASYDRKAFGSTNTSVFKVLDETF